MTTMTVTVNAQYAVQVDRFSEILERHRNDEDTLSKNLFRFGVEVLKKAKQHRFDAPETQARIAEECIGTLAREVLTCPLFVQRRLEDPVLERDWVWERAVHSDCFVVFDGISPLDQQPMEPNPPEHVFAREIMDLAGFSKPARESGEEQVALLSNDPSVAEAKKFVYDQLAMGAVQRRQSQQLRTRMAFSLVQTTGQLADMRLSNEQSLRNAESKAAAHEAALQRELETIRQIHQGRLAALNEQMTFLETTHKEKVSAVEKQIVEQAKVNQAVAATLRAQLSSMERAHQSAITAVGNQITSLTTAHQQLMHSKQQLETQRRQEAQAHQVQVSSILQKHQGEVNVLEQRVQAVSLQSQQRQLQNAANEAELRNLRQAYGHAQQEICSLRREVEDADDSFCVIS